MIKKLLGIFSFGLTQLLKDHHGCYNSHKATKIVVYVIEAMRGTTRPFVTGFVGEISDGSDARETEPSAHHANIRS